mgnify:CR=1 FL=1
MKIKTEVTHKVDYQELEKTIQEVYGWEFSVVADWEGKNDSQIEMHIDTKTDRGRLNEWIKTGKGDYMTRIIMCDLCANGFIPAGSYVIRISW